MKRKDKQFGSQRTLRLCVMIFSLLLVADHSMAADSAVDYPSRPVEYVTHVAAGNTLDVICRMISDVIKEEKLLSQPVVVVNKVGSAGAVAFGYVFERKGNPHMILAASSGTFILTPLREKLPYNYKLFTPIANMIVNGSVLVVRGDSPFKAAEDIIAEAKKRPKELIQGGASVTSNESMMGQSMQKTKGVKWNFIPFAGGDREAILNVLGGNVHFAFVNPINIIDHVRAGKLRVLLAGVPNRYPEFKDVPTIGEAGMGEPIVIYYGIVGPPNMPDYAVKKLEPVFKKVMENSRYKKFLKDSIMQPFWMSSVEYGKFLEKTNDQWKTWLSEIDSLKKK